MAENNISKSAARKKLLVRIVCAFLALIMIGSVAYLAIQLILDTIAEKKTETKPNTKAEISYEKLLLEDETFYTIA